MTYLLFLHNELSHFISTSLHLIAVMSLLFKIELLRLAMVHAQSTFKVCQPCVAYNLGQSSGNRRNEKRARKRKRHLGNDDNDGDGEEQSHYNCYDDAGYTNGECN